MQFEYPLNGPKLRLFRDYFRQKFHATLFYVSDSFINATFLEYQDNTDDPENLHGLVLDVIAMAEDAHTSSREMQKMVIAADKLTRLCPKCGGIGVTMPYMHPCVRCAGKGKVAPRRVGRL